MSKKNKPSSPFVYSTDPNFKFESEESPSENLSPADQQLRVWLETRHRGGKAATVIKGYVGSDDELEKIAKQLKNFCGTGGSAKDGEIIIQGDQRDKVLGWLQKNGFTKSKKAGG